MSSRSPLETRDRWDRARFDNEERNSRRGHREPEYYEEDEEEYYRSNRRDRSVGGFSRPDIEFEDSREKFVYRDRSRGPVRRRPEEYYEVRDVYERDTQRRPGLYRRQSSLDTFDRRPYSTMRRRDLSPEFIAIRQERYEPRHRRIPSPDQRDGLYDMRLERYRDYAEERQLDTTQEPRPYPRPGKTKIPLRMVRKEAIIDLGYSFHIEDQIIIVHQALGQQQIDEIIRYNQENLTVKSDRELGDNSSEKKDTRASNIEVDVSQVDETSSAKIGVAALDPHNISRTTRSRRDIDDQIKALQLEAQGLQIERINSVDRAGLSVEVAQRGTQNRRERRASLNPRLMRAALATLT